MIKGHLNIDNSALIGKCLELSKNIEVGTGGGYFVDVIDSHRFAPDDPNVNPHTWLEFQPVIDHLKHLIDPTEITKSWFNITLTGGVMNKHMHFQAPHSVLVYYINCNPDHPHLEFLVDDQWIEQKCVSGDWLIFPKNLFHRVPVNTGTGDRMSVSVNIGEPKLS
jgi:hypothetical protein